MNRKKYISKTKQKSSSENTADNKPLIRKKIKWRPIHFIGIVMLLFIAFWGGSSLWTYIQYLQLQFISPEEGLWENTLDAEAMILRNEYLLTAPIDGIMDAVVDEGQRVSEGSTIAYMVSDIDRQSIKAPKSGIVSYKLDGMEGVLETSNTDIDLDQIFALYPFDNYNTDNEDSIIGQGKAVAKIIDNLTEYIIVFKIPKDTIISKDINNIVFYAENTEETIKGSFIEVQNGAEHNYVLVLVSSQEDLLLYTRAFKASMVLEAADGFKVPSSAIITNENGDTGVFYRNGNRVSFLKVEVLFNNEEYAIVDSLKSYQTVIANPQKAEKGQKLY